MSNKWIPFIFLAAVLGSAFQVGTTIIRHDETNKQFCKLDTAVSKVFQTSLGSVTLAEAKKQPAAYERDRVLYNGYIIEFDKLAPCNTNVTLVPDLLASKPLKNH